MDSLAPGGLGCGDDVRDQEVALSRRRRAEYAGLIRQLDVQGVAIRRRVDGHRLDSQLVERADHAHDLAPIRDEDAREHAQLLDGRRRQDRLDLEQQLPNSTGCAFST